MRIENVLLEFSTNEPELNWPFSEPAWFYCCQAAPHAEVRSGVRLGIVHLDTTAARRMAGNTTRAPLTRWPNAIVWAAVIACRHAMGNGLVHQRAMDLAYSAYMAAGGDPAEVDTAIPKMLGAAARDHGEWFWRPTERRLARDERWMKACGMWPPP